MFLREHQSEAYRDSRGRDRGAQTVRGARVLSCESCVAVRGDGLWALKRILGRLKCLRERVG